MSEAKVLHCPHCGARVYETDDECMECGAELFPERAEAEAEGAGKATGAGEAAAAGKATQWGSAKSSKPAPGPPPAALPPAAPPPAAPPPVARPPVVGAPVSGAPVAHGDGSVLDVELDDADYPTTPPPLSPTAPPPAPAQGVPPAAPGPFAPAAAALWGAGAAPVDWRTLQAGGGFFDSLSRSWRFYKATLRMMQDYPTMVVPVGFALILGLVAVGALLALLFVAGLWSGGTSTAATLAPALFWVLMLPMMIYGYAVTLGASAMAVHMVDAYLRGRRAPLREAFYDVLRNLPALCYLVLANVAVSAVTSALRNRTILGSLLASAIEAAQRVATDLIVVVIMAEDKPLRAATDRAYQLFRPRALDVAVGEFSLLMIERVTGLVLGVGAFTTLSVASAIAAPVFVVALPAILGAVVLVSAVLGFVRIAYYTSLYVWATAMETAGTDAVPAPQPLAAALGYA